MKAMIEYGNKNFKGLIKQYGIKKVAKAFKHAVVARWRKTVIKRSSSGLFLAMIVATVFALGLFAGAFIVHNTGLMKPIQCERCSVSTYNWYTAEYKGKKYKVCDNCRSMFEEEEKFSNWKDFDRKVFDLR